MWHSCGVGQEGKICPQKRFVRTLLVTRVVSGTTEFGEAGRQNTATSNDEQMANACEFGIRELETQPDANHQFYGDGSHLDSDSSLLCMRRGRQWETPHMS